MIEQPFSYLNTAFALETSIQKLLSYQKSMNIDVCPLTDIQSTVVDLEFVHNFYILIQRYQELAAPISANPFNKINFDQISAEFKDFAEKLLLILIEDMLLLWNFLMKQILFIHILIC